MKERFGHHDNDVHEYVSVSISVSIASCSLPVQNPISGNIHPDVMSAEKESSNIGSPSLTSEKHATVTPTEGEVSAIERDEHNHILSKRVTRKCDLRLVPILCCLYLTAFLDRANLANARLLGFEDDLDMPANGYNTALWSFYLTFTIFEVPSNVLLSWSKCRPNVWLGTIVFMFGTVTMCQGFTKSAGGLYACRAIMGTFEGGLAPGRNTLQYCRLSRLTNMNSGCPVDGPVLQKIRIWNSLCVLYKQCTNW